MVTTTNSPKASDTTKKDAAPEADQSDEYEVTYVDDVQIRLTCLSLAVQAGAVAHNNDIVGLAKALYAFVLPPEAE